MNVWMDVYKYNVCMYVCIYNVCVYVCMYVRTCVCERVVISVAKTFTLIQNYGELKNTGSDTQSTLARFWLEKV